ncbi:MAG: single-stranded-DNA-specific exonuclease RecJ [Anaerolineae bacterium]|jgi:single-stranded-DNA-specific exonuclease
MTPSIKRWQVHPAVPPDQLSRFPHLHPLLVQVLHNRELIDPDAVTTFLEGTDEEVNPFALAGMSQAVSRIRRALRRGERIAVYGDFDADGVTATALLVQTLQALGGWVRPYIPHRVEEGYGLNDDAMETLAKDRVELVVTVDCGIRAFDEIDTANRLGLDVVVTDHHSVGYQMPDAVASVSPRQSREEGDEDPVGSFDGLAGVGVAYRLAQALLRSHRRTPASNQPVSLREEDLLDLVALGTVADLAPLRGENRALVRRGLERINDMNRPGIRALCRQAGLRPGRIDATSIGYVLGPRLNAAGRIADAEIAYRLLVAEQTAEAEELAVVLDGLNRDRQQMTREAQEMARELVLEAEEDGPMLFVATPEFSSGIVGLVASRLLDEFCRPAVVVEMGGEVSRGSCRSIDAFHITKALDACSDLLVRYGGHAAAAGFTVANANLEELRHRLRRLAANELSEDDLTPVLTIDAEVPLSEMTWDLLEKLALLEPCGYGNRQPVFASRDVQVRRYRAVGRGARHLKLVLSDGVATWEAIAFRQGAWAGSLPSVVDVAYHLELNEWRGQRRLQLNVQDIRLADGN